MYIFASMSFQKKKHIEIQDPHMVSGALTYNVCNGMGNQILSHAGFISYAVEHKIPVLIPDAYIINGELTSNDKRSGSFLDITPKYSPYVKLSDIFDTDHLIREVISLGIFAKLVPYENDVQGNLLCSWSEYLGKSDPATTLKIVNAFKPAPMIQNIVETIHVQIQGKNPVCVHHRHGEDWKAHCATWGGIPDGKWRHNCMEDSNESLSKSIKNRVMRLADGSLPPIFYVSDHGSFPNDLKSSFDMFSRKQALLKHLNITDENRVMEHQIKSNGGSISLTPQLLQAILTAEICPSHFRDICGIVDYLACSSMPQFIGNSVSVWSALQILQRNSCTTWYNSRSIPLSSIFRAYHVPLVYTYTEGSAMSGKQMLITSILSVRLHMPNSKIHILLHGREDEEFRRWLTENSVIIHQHEPKWLDVIEEMYHNGDTIKSHLFQHLGNYIGTWQRIDIPLYINAEYVLLLDCDTVIRAPFTYADLPLELTKSIAFSAEKESAVDPFNAGVALLNLPYLRETYSEFLTFIGNHSDNHPYRIKMTNGEILEPPSDQGAYLEFYNESKQFLHKQFNDKPYYTWGFKSSDQRRVTPPNKFTKILHFHGAKPHDYFGNWLGIKCKPAFAFLCDNSFKFPYLCQDMKTFAVAILSDKKYGNNHLAQYCSGSFSAKNTIARKCVLFFESLVRMDDALIMKENACQNQLAWIHLSYSQFGLHDFYSVIFYIHTRIFSKVQEYVA